MGAPGIAWFCRQGHLYEWLDEHLYWDETTDAQQAKTAAGCPCGETVVTSVQHYGEVNYGRDPGRHVVYQGNDELTRTEVIEGAHNGHGHPVTAYVDRRYSLPRFNVSRLDFPSSP